MRAIDTGACLKVFRVKLKGRLLRTLCRRENSLRANIRCAALFGWKPCATHNLPSLVRNRLMTFMQLADPRFASSTAPIYFEIELFTETIQR